MQEAGSDHTSRLVDYVLTVGLAPSACSPPSPRSPTDAADATDATNASSVCADPVSVMSLGARVYRSEKLFAASVLHRLPRVSHKDFDLPPGCPLFAYPSGIQPVGLFLQHGRHPSPCSINAVSCTSSSSGGGGHGQSHGHPLHAPQQLDSNRKCSTDSDRSFAESGSYASSTGFSNSPSSPAFDSPSAFGRSATSTFTSMGASTGASTGAGTGAWTGASSTKVGAVVSLPAMCHDALYSFALTKLDGRRVFGVVLTRWFRISRKRAAELGLPISLKSSSALGSSLSQSTQSQSPTQSPRLQHTLPRSGSDSASTSASASTPPTPPTPTAASCGLDKRETADEQGNAMHERDATEGFIRWYVPCSLVLLSHHPYHRSFFQLMESVADYSHRFFRPIVLIRLHALLKGIGPDCTDPVVRLAPSCKPVNFPAPSLFPLYDVDYGVLAECVSPQVLARCLSVLLLEQRVVIVGEVDPLLNDLTPVNASLEKEKKSLFAWSRENHASYRLVQVCEALMGLLSPFSWPHVYIPMLPSTLADILDAPVPYCLGIRRSDWVDFGRNTLPKDAFVLDLCSGVLLEPLAVDPPIVDLPVKSRRATFNSSTPSQSPSTPLSKGVRAPIVKHGWLKGLAMRPEPILPAALFTGSLVDSSAADTSSSNGILPVDQCIQFSVLGNDSKQSHSIRLDDTAFSSSSSMDHRSRGSVLCSSPTSPRPPSDSYQNSIFGHNRSGTDPSSRTNTQLNSPDSSLLDDDDDTSWIDAEIDKALGIDDVSVQLGSPVFGNPMLHSDSLCPTPTPVSSPTPIIVSPLGGSAQRIAVGSSQSSTEVSDDEYCGLFLRKIVFRTVFELVKTYPLFLKTPGSGTSASGISSSAAALNLSDTSSNSSSSSSSANTASSSGNPNQQGTADSIFDSDAFLADVSAEHAPFLRMLVQSQVFGVTINDRMFRQSSRSRGSSHHEDQNSSADASEDGGEFQQDLFDRLLAETMRRMCLQIEILASSSHRGWLTKCGKLRKSWKRRYVVLADRECKYFSDASCKSCKGSVPFSPGEARVIVVPAGVEARVAAPDAPHPFIFALVTKDRKLVCCVEDNQTRQQWVRVLRAKTMDPAIRKALEVHGAPRVYTAHGSEIGGSSFQSRDVPFWKQGGARLLWLVQGNHASTTTSANTTTASSSMGFNGSGAQNRSQAIKGGSLVAPLEHEDASSHSVVDDLYESGSDDDA
eukprot:ANDGO_00468.mRNA.1 hypothetical protein H696_03843